MSGQTAGAPGTLRPTPPKVSVIDAVWCGDALDLLNRLAPNSIDVAFADPPYNLQLRADLHRPDQSRVDGVTAAWDRFDDLAAYDAFTRTWLALVRRALKPNGTLWVIGSYHNIFRVGALMQDVGYWLLNDVVWVKVNPMPNFRGKRFTNAHETLVWAVADPKRTDYVFNYHSMKTFNDDVQLRSDWVLPLCGGEERLRDHRGRKAHPTQKPEALLARVILSSTRPGDVILDPFFGTGTTGAVARRLGRRFVGIEKEPGYVTLARDRIAQVLPLPMDALPAEKKREARIPFGWLLEAGLVAAGDELTGPGGVRARVLADGSIRAGDLTGSIHRVGAAVRGAAACNGWTFWHHVGPEGRLTPIDALRQDVRRALSLGAAPGVDGAGQPADAGSS